MRGVLWGLFGALSVLATAVGVQAQTVRLTEDLAYFDMLVDGETVRIMRSQDTEATISGEFARTSRACPPFCIVAMEAGEGVETLGETELLRFMNEKVQSGGGLLIDARLSEWYRGGTVPGAVNLPYNLLSIEENPYFDQILIALGGVESAEGWDFANARELALFCNGPWSDHSQRAIRNLMAAGYPAEKLKYYRGGMQMWRLLGLTVAVPTS